MNHPPREKRRCPCAARARVGLLALVARLLLIADHSAEGHEISQQRLTPVVIAVRQARTSVVSIRGQKTITEPAEPGSSTEASEAPRQVNGMGTGTIIDERGYIL